MVSEAHGVWAVGDGKADTKCWVHTREIGDCILIDVPDYKSPMLDPDSALYLSRQIRRLALRIKRRTEEGE